MKEMEIKNHGLVLPEKIETREEGAEHILGEGDPIINPTGQWKWLNGEEQRRRGIETNGCTVFNTLRAIQTLIKFKTGIQVNYSDRYLANVAKFKGILDPRSGADPHKIAELIRTVAGCLREERLPWSDDIKTVDDYYDVKNLTELMREGEQWYNEWEFRHKWVFNGGTPQEKAVRLKDALTKGTVCLSGVAWVFDSVNQYYIKQVGERDGHWTGLERYDGENPIIEDSYPESEGDFEKVLAPNYDSNIAKVYYLTLAQPKLTLMSYILTRMSELISAMAALFKKKQEAPPINFDLPPPIVLHNEDIPPVHEDPSPESISYLWDTFANARHSVRLIADEEGLSVDMKNKLCETIKCESGFNTKAEHKNSNGTTDYGICQYNSFWYIGTGKPIPSVEIALNDPEFCVRVMCRQFKKGHAKDWACYKRLYP